MGRDRASFVVPAAVAFAADALSKLVAVSYLDDRDLEFGVVALRLAYNAGIAFGLGADAPLALVFGGTVAVTSVVAVAAWRGVFGNPVGAGLIVGGAVANVADRSLGGSVVDMIDVGWWPTFNLADVFINVGIVLTLLAALRTPRQAGTDSHAVLDQARSLLAERHHITHATLQVEPDDHTGCDDVAW